MWLGDYTEDFTTLTCMFTTHDTTGAPVAPLTAFEAGDVLIYKNGNAAQKTSTNGVTMTSPFDSIVGLHCLTIDTSNDTGDGGFWVAGAVYTLVLSPDTETVNAAVVAKVIGQFGIELANDLRPTVAGRKLDVSAGGEAGLDWANIGSPTTAQNLSSTNIDVDQIVASVSGNVTGSVGSVAGNVTGSVGSVAGNVTGSVGSVAGNVTGSVGSVAAGGIAAASFAAGAIDATAIATDAIGSDELAASAANEVADALLDRAAGVETGMTVRQAMRLILAALAGKLSGAATTTVVIRDTTDAKDRITATVDASGNRSAVTLDTT